MMNMKVLMAAGGVLLSAASVRADVEYVAHQGEEWLAPNHSRAAYRLALEHGLEILKLDLHPTKDGRIVICHDDNLKAMLGWDENIRDHALAEIKAHVMRPRGGYTNETVCTLEEALEYGVRTKKGVWLDFKEFSPSMFEQAIRLCDAAGLKRGKVCVATWNTTALEYCRDRYPAIRRVRHVYVKRPKDGSRGFLTNTGGDRVFPDEDALVKELLRERDALKLYGFNMPHIVQAASETALYHTTENVLRKLEAAGLWISIWFVEDELTGEMYRRWGADAFVTSCKARTLPGYRAAHPDESYGWLHYGPGWPGEKESAKWAASAAKPLPMRGICAHQGGVNDPYPGNSLASISNAVASGVQMIELDVAECRTGEFVLTHDGKVDNEVKGGFKGRVGTYALAELQKMERRGRVAGVGYASFDDALNLIPREGMWINIDVRGSGRRYLTKLIDFLRERGRLHQAFLTTSHEQLALAREIEPKVLLNNIGRTGPRDRDWTDDECQRFVDDTVRYKCQFLQLSRPWARKYSDICHAAGIRVIHFWVQKPEELKDLMVDRGIDFPMVNSVKPMMKACEKERSGR